jgi:hypothetical protein
MLIVHDDVNNHLLEIDEKNLMVYIDDWLLEIHLMLVDIHNEYMYYCYYYYYYYLHYQMDILVVHGRDHDLNVVEL